MPLYVSFITVSRGGFYMLDARLERFTGLSREYLWAPCTLQMNMHPVLHLHKLSGNMIPMHIPKTATDKAQRTRLF
jgi:hypothetical protein